MIMAVKGPSNETFERRSHSILWGNFTLNARYVNVLLIMPAPKPVKPDKALSFDDAIRGAMKVPPPPTGKKAKRRIWRKKSRKG
jgi:hypothetical protein